ncbi:unnamed protein product [Brassica oleracea var. botrytis]|nr:unnamed protein product [Brassica napus]CDY16579.1 BnaC09g36940D [Brassica napus]
MVLRGYTLYITTSRRFVRVLDLSGGHEQGSSSFKETTRPFPMLSCYESCDSSIAVTTSGEVLLVESDPWNRTWFRVYKKNPDLKNPDSSCHTVLEVDSLGGEALLLDLGFTVPANDTLGIEPDSIYFTRHYRPSQWRGRDLDICVYNLASKSLKRFSDLDSPSPMAMETKTHLLEVLQTEILGRLPLKTISRFKSVCKKWKSTIESTYFRRLFFISEPKLLLFMYGRDELIVFHGHKTWDDLPKSPVSLIPHSFRRYYIGDCDYRDSSGGLVLITDGSDKASCYVGSPVTQQWVKIPPPPSSDPKGDSTVFGLVTRLDEDGVVLSFKVIRIASYQATNDYLSSDLGVLLYSSETGVWTSKVIHSPHQIGDMSNINLNGTFYFGCLSVPGILLAHDFYSESDQFRVVQLPDYPDHNKDYKRTLTTSGGFVMYARTLAKKEETVLKIWRLMNNDDYSWQLLWEVGFPITGNYAPMAMHPFDVATVYLWSQRDHHLVSCNLLKGNYTILGDAANDGHQDCFIDKSVCKQSVDELWRSSSDLDEDLNFQVCIWLFQFVIPRWMESVPRPPQAEMIDTTSLLSYAAATHGRMMKDIEEEEYFWNEDDGKSCIGYEGKGDARVLKDMEFEFHRNEKRGAY